MISKERLRELDTPNIFGFFKRAKKKESVEMAIEILDWRELAQDLLWFLRNTDGEKYDPEKTRLRQRLANLLYDQPEPTTENLG